MESVIVVIPTYNEKDNIETLIKYIFDLGIPNLKAMIVDDNSPDATGKLAERLAKTYPILVLHRAKKEGLGLAYRDAFEHILNMPRDEVPDFIIHMDADLSHDAAMIPAMLKKIKDCDLVLGSRYVRGGKIENWNFLRRILSRCSNFYARSVLNLPYQDMTGGFKCYRKETLAKIDLSSLNAIGYNFLIETTYKAHKAGCNIREIPISFTERVAGKSKIDIPVIVESFINVIGLKLQK